MTRAEIAAKVESRMLTRSSELSAVQRGDPLKHLIGDGLAGAAHDLHSKASEVYRDTILSEARGDGLRRIGRDHGVDKLASAKAWVIARLSGPNAPSAYVDVTKGTRFWRAGADGESVEYETTQDPAILETGTVVTSGTTSTITVAGAGWVADEYKYATVVLTDAVTSDVQSRLILSNTSTTLTVQTLFTHQPANPDTFDIVTAKIPVSTDAWGAATYGLELHTEAVNDGTQGNAIAGAIKYASSFPSPIDTVTNPNAATGGSDLEDDVPYSERISDAREASCGVSDDGIKQRVLAFTDSTDEKPLRSVGVIEESGAVGIYIDDGSGAPLATLVADVQDWVDGEYTDSTVYGVGAAGIERTVYAAANKVIQIRATLTLRKGVDPSLARNAGKLGIWQYITGRLGVGDDLYPRDLLAAIASPDYLDIDLEYNLGAGWVTSLDLVSADEDERFWMYEEPSVTTA
jgi:phage-related baseplate assembly protein